MHTVEVKDVMTSDVVSVQEDTPFKELVAIMVDRGIGGVPVVDAADHTLVGIVTKSDLLAVEAGDVPTHRRRRGHGRKPSEDIRARDLMTPDVETTMMRTPVREAAHRMVERGVKRLPVVESGRLVGIVSRVDLLQPFLRPDEDIRREILDDLVARTLWLDDSGLDIRVERGVVHIKGTVDRRSDRDVLLRLIHTVDGVVGVEGDLAYLQDDRRIRPSAIPTSRVTTTSMPGDFTPGGLRG